MKKILYLLLLCFIAVSCHDVTVGYLFTEDVAYKPDSLVAKAVIDTTLTTTSEADYKRMKWDIPYVSVPIEGLEGTPQIYITITEIKSLTGTEAEAAKLKTVLRVRGDGTIVLPCKHGVAPGRYLLSLNFRNEGYSKDRPDIFTVIVK